MLLIKIESDLKEAMLAGDKPRAETLRLLVSSLKNAQIAAHGELRDEEAARVVAKEAKQRRESIEAFTAGARPELAAREKQELEVIERYLPEQLSEDEVKRVVLNILAGLETPDFGQAMAGAMRELKGQADGALVSRIVQVELSKRG